MSLSWIFADLGGKAAIKVKENGNKFPSPDDKLPIMDIIIVAYLPNEQDIVKDQVSHREGTSDILMNLLLTVPLDQLCP